MYCYNCMKEIDDNSIYCPFCHATVKDNCAPHHLKPGTVLNNRYLVGNSIGEGGFGITYIGRDLKLDMRIAVKEFYPAGFANRFNTYSNNVNINYKNGGEYFKSGVERFLQEAKSIAKFNNESSIVDVRDYFEENDTAYIIMEYLEGENLSEKLERDGTFNPDEIFKLFLPIMHTLEKMHRENIIHRDITPQNIRVMPDGSFKLIDFGSARYYDGVDKRTLSVQLKPGYAPIEQYNKNGNQGPWTDVYGLCATIYKCITGKTPLDSLERIQNDTLQKPSSLGVNISASLENVLMSGLEVDAGKRCKNMDKLISNTELALSDEIISLESQNFSETYEDIYSNWVASDNHSHTDSDKINNNSANESDKFRIADTDYRKRAADDEYKTMPANRAYGDTQMYKDANPNDFSHEKFSNKPKIKQQSSVRNPNSNSNALDKQAESSKNKSGISQKEKMVIIVCCWIALVIFIVLGIGICVSIKNDTKQTKKASSNIIADNTFPKGTYSSDFDLSSSSEIKTTPQTSYSSSPESTVENNNSATLSIVGKTFNVGDTVKCTYSIRCDKILNSYQAYIVYDIKYLKATNAYLKSPAKNGGEVIKESETSPGKIDFYGFNNNGYDYTSGGDFVVVEYEVLAGGNTLPELFWITVTDIDDNNLVLNGGKPNYSISLSENYS